MLKAIYFALHFAMIFLGVIIAIHFDFWLGTMIAGTFAVKWFFMFPQVGVGVDNDRFILYDPRYENRRKKEQIHRAT